ncbi:unnamed protein product [Arctia plantaginis]|uniref:Uncharacterized protein n=1 Tax=Arctia plantaginis TaxID=874455 RepID=A0A8S1BEN2_ARCPL|nr:unnamed protein product [Arctia plantaginis]
MGPLHNPYVSYSTDAKSSMKKVFAEEMFLHNFHLSPDTLRKNLADTIITQEKMAPKNGKMKLEKETSDKETVVIHEDVSPLSGITNFLSGVMNVISNVMFTKRKPAEFSSNSDSQTAPPSMWHNANLSDENKNPQSENFTDDLSSEFFASEMSDCRTAAAHCQSKLDQVRLLLGTNKPTQCSLRVRKRPKKVFVEPSCVEDCFEDAFSPEDFENLANESYIEFYSPICYHDHSFHDIESPKTKVDVAVIPKEDPKSSYLVSDPLEELVTSRMVSHTHSIEDDVSNVNRDVAELKSEITGVNKELPKVVPEDHLVHKVTEPEKYVPELNKNKLDLETKKEVVEACEDKITKLKLLLQSRSKKPKVEGPAEETATVTNSPVSFTLESKPLVTLPPRPKPSYKVKDKRFKNPNRCTDKRQKSKMKKSIEDDLVFANEINSEDLFSSVEISPSTNYLENHMKSVSEPIQDSTVPEVNKNQSKPVPTKEYFDEVSGCFRPSSVESDDSFQIVFHDSPRSRQESDCESDDFDIVFEESPDCYTSNDVFRDSDDSSDSEEDDSDSDVSDSECNTFKLSASLSKSVCNLADDSLYEDQSEDEVDCAHIQNLSICDSVADSEIDDTGDYSKGVLVDERKKMLKKKLPAKRVRFSPNPPKVHVMRVWLFAAKQTRVRYWQQFAVDRERFKRRIADIDMAVSWVLKPQHRSRIMFQRFMPWWNAQKRKEIAEKKEKEAQEKLKEDERLKNEEIEVQNSELLQESKEADKNVSGENTDSCISLSQEEATYSEDGELGNSNSNVTPISTVEADANITLVKDRVIEDKGSKKENIIGNNIESKDNKNVSFENTNQSNKGLNEKLPLNDNKLASNSDFVNLHLECANLNT